MKILQVSPYFKPYWDEGGLPRITYDLSKSLADRGHEVTVYTIFRGSGDQELTPNGRIEMDGMTVHYFDGMNELLPSVTKDMSSIPYMLPHVAKKEMSDFDLIHIHSHRHLLEAAIHRIALRRGKPYVLQAHGSAPRNGNVMMKKVFDALWGYSALRGASSLVAVSEVERLQYQALGVGEARIDMIPNALNLKNFDQPRSKGAFRRALRLSDDERMVLYLGRINRHKGLDVLLQAFHEYRKKNKEAVLVIAGPDQGYKKEVLALVNRLNLGECVRFHDFVAEITTALADADVLVYPSPIEIFGLIPFEAIACGTPVVVSDGCGCGEWIRKMEAGYVFRSGDVVDLSHKIDESLSNPEEGRTLMDKGRRYIKEYLTWDKVVVDFEMVYQYCMNDI